MSTLTNVSVPEEHLALYQGFAWLIESRGPESARQLLAGALAGSTMPLEVGEGSEKPSISNSDGREAYLARFWRESPARLRRALQMVLEAGDVGITTVDLAERLQYPHGAMSVAGMFGAAGNRVQRRYGEEATVPWESVWRDAGNGHGGSIVTIKPEWREVLSKVIRDHG